MASEWILRKGLGLILLIIPCLLIFVYLHPFKHIANLNLPRLRRGGGPNLDNANITSKFWKRQDDYTCGPGRPCSNGACCGASGYCGYGATYCGDGCSSNCGAHAECGKDALIPGTECPLKTCCSEFGFVSLHTSDSPCYLFSCLPGLHSDNTLFSVVLLPSFAKVRKIFEACRRLGSETKVSHLQ